MFFTLLKDLRIFSHGWYSLFSCDCHCFVFFTHFASGMFCFGHWDIRQLHLLGLYVLSFSWYFMFSRSRSFCFLGEIRGVLLSYLLPPLFHKPPTSLYPSSPNSPSHEVFEGWKTLLRLKGLEKGVPSARPSNRHLKNHILDLPAFAKSLDPAVLGLFLSERGSSLSVCSWIRWPGPRGEPCWLTYGSP